MTQKTRSCRLIAIFPRNEFNALQWSSTKYQTSLRRNRKELTKVALRLHNSELFHDLGVNKTKRPDFYLRISYIMHLLCYRHSFEKREDKIGYFCHWMIPRPVWKISWVVYIQKFHLNTRLATAADNTNWILHASKRIRIIKIYISPTFLQKEMNTLYCSCLWHIKFHQLLPRGRGIFILSILMRPNKMLIY